MTWERAQEMTDTELEVALFRDSGRNVAATRAAIDYGHVHEELHRSGVTLQLLWSEYLDRVAARGDGTKPYQYSQFCELYGAWRSRLQPSMRIVHRAGEKAFVDYSGKQPKLWDREAGEPRAVELFVMVLGASSYTYAEATLTQRSPCVRIVVTPVDPRSSGQRTVYQGAGNNPQSDSVQRSVQVEDGPAHGGTGGYQRKSASPGGRHRAANIVEVAPTSRG